MASNAFATAEVLFPPCRQPALSASSFAMKLTVVAPPECQVVLSGCTIMFQGNFESSPSFPIFLHNPDAGGLPKQLEIKTAKVPQPLAPSSTSSTLTERSNCGEFSSVSQDVHPRISAPWSNSVDSGSSGCTLEFHRVPSTLFGATVLSGDGLAQC